MLARISHIYCMALEMNDPMKPKTRQKRALRILSWRKKSVHADGKLVMPPPFRSQLTSSSSPPSKPSSLSSYHAQHGTLYFRQLADQVRPSSPPRKGNLNQVPGQLHVIHTLPLHLIESPEKLGALSQRPAWVVCMIRDLGCSLLESLPIPPSPYMVRLVRTQFYP